MINKSKSSEWSADGTRASRLLLVCSGKPKLFSQLLLHGAQGVLVRTAGGPMVAFANTTRHDLLPFKFVHWIFILVLGIQVLQEVKSRSLSQIKSIKKKVKAYLHYYVDCYTLMSSSTKS